MKSKRSEGRAQPTTGAELDDLRTRIQTRFGVVPSFFMLAGREPAIVAALLRMAEFAYLDSPIPALFKERLFTYVSRFCRVPYCMTRHCGFLLGRGHVAGNGEIEAATLDDALAMLRTPFPAATAHTALLERLRILDPVEGWPEPDSPAERDLFVASAVVFVRPGESGELLREIRRVLGDARYQYLALFLSFIRFAHFWTETHPELRLEADLERLLSEQRELADWVSGYGSEVADELEERVHEELEELEGLRARASSLQEANLALFDEVVDRTRAAEVAEAANEAKARFMATVSHELRTPLSAIVGYTELLAAGVAGDLPPEARRFIERIRSSARHQHALIEEVLAFSRLEAGQDEVVLAPVGLQEVWDEVSAVVEPLARGKGLTFRVETEGAPAEIRTDGRKLRQILLHLLGNAVKFTEEGEVHLAAEASGGALVLRVRDTGVGIPPADRERIFQPFTQADDSMRRLHGGPGLGLTITRRLLELLDGSIAVRSEPGHGTTFNVRLPAGADRAASAEDGG